MNCRRVVYWCECADEFTQIYIHTISIHQFRQRTLSPTTMPLAAFCADTISTAARHPTNPIASQCARLATLGLAARPCAGPDRRLPHALYHLLYATSSNIPYSFLYLCLVDTDGQCSRPFQRMLNLPQATRQMW